MSHSEFEHKAPAHFIHKIIEEDLNSGKHTSIVTRFPPEPNGFLHIGHAKSICLNFGLAEQFNGACHLRFDDTNPEKENQVYIDAIAQDVQWLGFQWHGPVRYASEYFQALYDYAIELINMGKAYVCSLTAEQTREYRGTLTEPGKPSPYRDRSIADNLDLFSRMQAGEFDEGAHVLRAKIDMASPNLNMRDPVIYRIKKAHHHQTGDHWNVYPMYDYTHCISDAIEGITHSICTLEFEDHRPLYDWVLDQLPVSCHPRQIEFARLNLNYTITSKRKLKRLVDEGFVVGWDDPRLHTIAGLRRRGYTPASLRNFCEAIGVARADSVVDMAMLEFSIRDDLDKHAPRIMCVLDPLKVTITNYGDDAQWLEASNHPKDESLGKRKIPFTRTLYIDRNDFMEDPPKDYFRLSPGKEVRLRGAYILRCDQVVRDPQTGAVIELKSSIDPETLGKNPEGRKVKGVIHWVSADHAVPCEVRLYDRFFTEENPEAAGDFFQCINPNSLVTLKHCWIEPSVMENSATHFQFEREGYFCVDCKEDSASHRVFNRTVTLKDSWAKIEAKK